MKNRVHDFHSLLACGILAMSACTAASKTTPDSTAGDATLTVVAPARGVIKSEDGSIDCGSQCTVTKPLNTTLVLTAATTDPGWRFAFWSQGCAELITPTCRITLPQALTAAATFVPISCSDGIENGNETDVDCGGTSCSGCAPSQACKVAADCASGAQCISQRCTITTSCAALHALSPNLPSGMYTLDPDGPEGELPFSAYCDMSTDGGGWTLVHKLTSGIAADTVALWTGGAPLNEGNQGFLNVTKSTDHYLNRIATKYWNTNGLTISEVRVGVYTAGTEVAYVQFNNIGTDRNAWYSAANLAKSTWTDIGTETRNHFSIQGETSAGRTWYINRAYQGCPGDTGWLTVDVGSDPCAWESVSPKVAVLYVPGTVYGNWTQQVAQADVFAVFVR